MKKIKPADNSANMPNKNAGISGVNKQFQQVQTNKNKQQKSAK